MKEIGGYFGLEQFVDNEYYKDLIRLNTGRNALLYILKAKNIQKIYIPYYLCDSISNMLKMHDYNYEYYHIDAEFNPIFNKSLGLNESIFIVNYYGQLTIEKIKNFKSLYKNVIVDNTHAFFQKPVEEIDTIYSCRKFFGVPDGAYVSTDSILHEELKIDISKGRMDHILGRYEGIASEYYSDFKKNDEMFKTIPLKYMSKLTRNLLGAIDYEKVKSIRDKNFAYLDDRLGEINRLNLIKPEGSFAYPFYSESSVELRKRLIEKKIYIPTLWPNVLEDMPKDSNEYDYVANILPLPCDQRYEVEDMRRVIKNIKVLL
ncbi:MAG: hypothetical protein M0P77_03895 [Firmicutes bacterium]|nr:hypothetical protein [Bacillota bacterium]